MHAHEIALAEEVQTGGREVAVVVVEAGHGMIDKHRSLEGHGQGLDEKMQKRGEGAREEQRRLMMVHYDT